MLMSEARTQTGYGLSTLRVHTDTGRAETCLELKVELISQQLVDIPTPPTPVNAIFTRLNGEPVSVIAVSTITFICLSTPYVGTLYAARPHARLTSCCT